MFNFSNNNFYIGTPVNTNPTNATPVFEAIVLNDTEGKTKKTALINIKELDSTLTKKYTGKKSNFRTDGKSVKESKYNFGSDLNFINKKLKTADKQYNGKKFEDALELYNDVLRTNGLETLLSKKSYNDILKYAQMCHAELAINTKSPEVKQKWLLEGYQSLRKYLKKETNLKEKSPVFEYFAIILYQTAMDSMGKDNKEAFKNLKLLLTLDLNSKELIQPDLFSGIIDDILYNMTVCIEKEEDKQDNTAIDMRMEMKGLLKHKFIDNDKQDHYSKWLDEGMEEETILATLYKNAVQENFVLATVYQYEEKQIDNTEGPVALHYFDLEGSQSSEESIQADKVNSLTIEHILKRGRNDEDDREVKKTKNV